MLDGIYWEYLYNDGTDKRFVCLHFLYSICLHFIYTRKKSCYAALLPRPSGVRAADV